MYSGRKTEERKIILEEEGLKTLREEFDKRLKNRHPKTSYQLKRSTNPNNKFNNILKKIPKYNKALSANKYKRCILTYITNNNISRKTFFDLSQKYPGYLYYKEILSTNKNGKYKQNNTFSENFTNRKNNNKSPIKNKQNLPKIASKKKIGKIKLSFLNQMDKKNPYSLFWPNKMLNKNDCSIKIRGIEFGVPIIGSKINTIEDFILKNSNSDKKKLYQSNQINNRYNKRTNTHHNNYFLDKNKKMKVNKDKIQIMDKNKEKKVLVNRNFNINKEKEDKIRDENDKIKNEEKKEHFNDKSDDSLDENQQEQFYKNQQNFFKARKDIKEEPSSLEEED